MFRNVIFVRNLQLTDPTEPIEYSQDPANGESNPIYTHPSTLH
jgi:hypothetical protein